ncbi:phosphoribosylglycinamide formyltransferase [Pseudomonas syringae pv. actinidiae ICMP 19070]|nr:phosphoribosylglycinamide formyltransferase [Pseudomonas syringae pv. actinidiae ICMP 19070]
MSATCDVVVLLSGTGGNLQAMIDSFKDGASPVRIRAVISNREDAFGLQRARILSAGFVRHYQGRLLNIHPSLLPHHKGLHTHKRVLEAGEAEHGCSVHFVTEELDGGPLVVQAVISVQLHDTPAALAQRVHVQEHRIYPLAIRWFAEGRLSLGEHGALLDSQLLPASGHLIRH